MYMYFCMNVHNFVCVKQAFMMYSETKVSGRSYLLPISTKSNAVNLHYNYQKALCFAIRFWLK